MADWSVWKALEEWRVRRNELAPIFAKAGVAAEVGSAVNMVCVNLRRHPPTPPLLTGEKTRDEEEFGRYYEGYFRHYDDSLLRIESLLRLPWVPETSITADKIRTEVARLRQAMRERPGKNPGFEGLEKLLHHYVNLDDPDMARVTDTLIQRRKQLIDIAGYPLLVQHALADPYTDSIPPLYTSVFQQELYQRMRVYKEAEWLHNRLISNAYMLLALDAFYAYKKREVQDDSRIARTLHHRWPSLSVLMPNFEQADQVWYLFLIIIAVCTIFLELWWLALLVIIWLNISIGAHRRERKSIEARRAQLLGHLQTVKRTRDRFSANQLTLEKLAFQFQQLDESGTFFDPVVMEITGLHQHEG